MTRIDKKTAPPRSAGTLMVRLDPESKRCLTEAATLRQVSVSDYVRTVLVPQAKRDIAAAREQTISLSPEEQLAFWNALNATPVLTRNQRKLGAIMRGEA